METATMILANELRIGNWVLDDYSDEQPKPYRIEGDDISRAAVNGVPYSPIPLTPDILKAAGFDKQSFFEGIATGVYEKEGLKIGLHGDDFVKNQYTAAFGDTFVKVKYMHQLQNIFFALTGTELEISL